MKYCIYFAIPILFIGCNSMNAPREERHQAELSLHKMRTEVEDWLGSLLPICELVWVDARLYERGAARARQARKRKLSLTDCVSFEAMVVRGCREAIADDADFTQAGFQLCEAKGH